jgi:HD superfamily phosphodiesterase
MNRIEKVREYVDNVIQNVKDPFEKRCAYLHLYGVSQACTMIALKRNENVELATIAGMLHDIYTYAMNDSNNHANKGAIMAKEILTSLAVFNDDEIKIICSSIHNHSDKESKHSSFDEILIDADVMQHNLYNPFYDVVKHEYMRFEKLKKEFGLN